MAIFKEEGCTKEKKGKLSPAYKKGRLRRLWGEKKENITSIQGKLNRRSAPSSGGRADLL